MDEIDKFSHRVQEALRDVVNGEPQPFDKRDGTCCWRIKSQRFDKHRSWNGYERTVWRCMRRSKVWFHGYSFCNQHALSARKVLNEKGISQRENP